MEAGGAIAGKRAVLNSHFASLAGDCPALAETTGGNTTYRSIIKRTASSAAGGIIRERTPINLHLPEHIV